jgi:hypothetical protein
MDKQKNICHRYISYIGWIFASRKLPCVRQVRCAEGNNRRSVLPLVETAGTGAAGVQGVWPASPALGPPRPLFHVPKRQKREATQAGSGSYRTRMQHYWHTAKKIRFMYSQK